MGSEIGYKNLIPFSERTEEEQRAIRLAGGKASGVARRKISEIQRVATLLSKIKLKGKSREDLLEAGVDESDITQLTAAVQGMFNATINQNPSAGKVLCAMLGTPLKTEADIEIKGDLRIEDIIKKGIGKSDY